MFTRRSLSSLLGCVVCLALAAGCGGVAGQPGGSDTRGKASTSSSLVLSFADAVGEPVTEISELDRVTVRVDFTLDKSDFPNLDPAETEIVAQWQRDKAGAWAPIVRGQRITLAEIVDHSFDFGSCWESDAPACEGYFFWNPYFDAGSIEVKLDVAGRVVRRTLVVTEEQVGFRVESVRICGDAACGRQHVDLACTYEPGCRDWIADGVVDLFPGVRDFNYVVFASAVRTRDDRPILVRLQGHGPSGLLGEPYETQMATEGGLQGSYALRGLAYGEVGAAPFEYSVTMEYSPDGGETWQAKDDATGRAQVFNPSTNDWLWLHQ